MEIHELSELVEHVCEIGRTSENLLVFRGEEEDYGDAALIPPVYREGYIENENIIYRESQRFNDEEFTHDQGVFDRLSRIQHYTAPTRLIDVSEDLLSAIYFAISDKVAGADGDAVVHIFEIDKRLVKYYDSDTVTVVSNLAKIPLRNDTQKSKEALLKDCLAYRDDLEGFNRQTSARYFLHEIRHEKVHFDDFINPRQITSIQFVLPKLTSTRLRSQKGAFLLFGLSPDGPELPIKLIQDGNLRKSNHAVQHPVIAIHKAYLRSDNIESMQRELHSLGIRKPFIFPEIDRVSEFLKARYRISDTKCMKRW